MTVRVPRDPFPHGDATTIAGNEAPAPLPAVTSLIGREREIAAIITILDQPGTRLLTLTGPDGVGKTQLGLAIGWKSSEAVVFVPLAYATSTALVIAAIAQALGASEQQAETLLENLIDTLRAQPTRLILDGAEHAAAVVPVIRQLLAECPDLVLLVTATDALGIDGERVYQVPPLTFPVGRNWPRLSEAERGAAVALFIECARLAEPEFTLTMANAFTVAEICRRLEGLPLAIEIAAARTRQFPPQPMLARLNRHLPQPVEGSTTPEQQEAILHSTIAWSYDLLTSSQQLLLRELAVFAGGIDADAIDAIHSGPNRPDDLAGLLTTSLLQADARETERRYQMLEPVRVVMLDRLAASGEASVVRQRHAYWALDLARSAGEGLRGAEQRNWLTRLESEIDNLRMALKWFYTSGQHEEGVKLASSLTRFWATRAHVSEGWLWIKRGLANPDALTPATRAQALTEGSWLALLQSRVDDASQLAAEALDVYVSINDAEGIAISLDTLGELAVTSGDFANALTRFDESMAIWNERGRDWNVAMSLISVACATLNLDDIDRSEAACNQARTMLAESGDRRGEALAIISLGWLELQRGDIAAATDHFTTARTILQQIGAIVESAEAIEGLAAVADAGGDRAEAIRSFNVAQDIRSATGIHRDFMSRLGHLADRRALRQRLSEKSP